MQAEQIAKTLGNAKKAFTPMREALDRLKDADRVIKLLTAEAIVENVMRDIDEDDLAADMLEQVLEIMAVIIERS